RKVAHSIRPIRACPAVVDHRLCCTRPPEVTKTRGGRNGILLRPILVLQCDAARMALGDASWYAAPVDHHSGSTGGEYPASTGPQPMVDDPRVCAAGKSDRLMGVCVHPMAQPRFGRWSAGVTAPAPSQPWPRDAFRRTSRTRRQWGTSPALACPVQCW